MNPYGFSQYPGGNQPVSMMIIVDGEHAAADQI